MTIDQNILVSICCVTYNHENFLRQCLDGFVMQKTKFQFEILVHEDASTDNTAIILKEYETKYPHLFLCVYQTVNQFAIQNTLINILFPMAKGKYVALCEGDDYWTDPYKLQKQVDFLEANKDYNICFHSFHELNDQGVKSIPLIKYNDKPMTYTIEDLATENFISTPTVMFRNNILPGFPAWFLKSPVGDYIIYLLLAEKGKIYFMPDVMAVYRKHGGGVWSQKPNYQQALNLKWVIDKMDKHFNYKYHRYFYNKKLINDYHLSLLDHYKINRKMFRYFIMLFRFMVYKKTMQKSFGYFSLLGTQYFIYNKAIANPAPGVIH